MPAMRKGRLNKPELARITRAFRDINQLVNDLPKNAAAMTDDEKATCNILVDARNRLGELLRWQDFGGAWQAAIKTDAG